MRRNAGTQESVAGISREFVARGLLWQNDRLLAWKVRGVVSAVTVAWTEPVRPDYHLFLRAGHKTVRRGTMMGRPPLPGTTRTFHGSTCYNPVELTIEDGGRVSIPQVAATIPLQGFLTVGKECSFYLLSPKIPGDGCTLAFAARSDDGEAADLDGVGSIADNAWSNLRLQLAPVIISALLFFGFFIGTGLSLARRLQPAGALTALTGFIVALTVFLPAGMLAGWAMLKRKIMVFPDRAVFAAILRDDGWSLPDEARGK